jgi:hypothetical protein
MKVCDGWLRLKPAVDGVVAQRPKRVYGFHFVFTGSPGVSRLPFSGNSVTHQVVVARSYNRFLSS